MTTAVMTTQLTPFQVADKYLKIYNADIDWIPHVEEVYARLTKQNAQNATEELRKRMACTILLPYYEKNVIQDPPQNLLFFCHKWTQFTSRDWYEEFKEIKTQDARIEEIREECLNLGVVYPLVYNPITRQAYNWLCDEAVASGVINESNKEAITKKLMNLVYVYGGVVVCSVFGKPELKPKINGIANWRSGYFFERLIHSTYKREELIKIKTHELNKVRHTDSKLVKNIKSKEETHGDNE
jgi:hypothetical protein